MDSIVNTESIRKTRPVVSTSLSIASTLPLKCPPRTPEFERVRNNHAILASTGCTRDFCQAGRSIHTDEARVGENRTVDVVEQECVEFLNEMRQDGHFKTDEEFEDRMNSALDEIRSSCRQAIVRGDRDEGTVGGNWMQTSKELEFGIRRAWRNARKCIMRSHCEELQLVDLRAVTTSKDMAIELIKGMTAAFDDGNIRPTVFVFPPRAIDERGPMIWNSQVLSFAGYEIEDDSILGDPMNAQLTKDIIELGWKPPETKSRWDLLPLVTMAFGDAPAVVELPPNLRQLVDIRHPRYSAEFERMDLKWVPFPALTRFGFDIGGVQYTATPFIGWFMDAEIGVRDLADSFRYNVLPEIALALGPEDIKSVSLENFGDLPEYEKLALLVRFSRLLVLPLNHSSCSVLPIVSIVLGRLEMCGNLYTSRGRKPS